LQLARLERAERRHLSTSAGVTTLHPEAGQTWRVSHARCADDLRSRMSASATQSVGAQGSSLRRRPGKEAHRLRRTSFNHTCVRHRAGSACPRDCTVCGQQHVSPPFIHGKSRMRKRARTELLGGAISDGRPLPRQLSRSGRSVTACRK
jgi:hypothetical protein